MRASYSLDNIRLLPYAEKKEIVVDKTKFDELLTRMLNTPPLPKSEIRVAHPKTTKKTQGRRKT